MKLTAVDNDDGIAVEYCNYSIEPSLEIKEPSDYDQDERFQTLELDVRSIRIAHVKAVSFETDFYSVTCKSVGGDTN